LEAAATRTARGEQQQLNNTWGDTKEILGSLTNETLKPFFSTLNDGLAKSQPVIERWANMWEIKLLAIRTGIGLLGESVRDMGTGWGERMPDAQRQSAITEYRQITGDHGAFLREMQATGLIGERVPQHMQKWHEILAKYRDPGTLSWQADTPNPNLLGRSYASIDDAPTPPTLDVTSATPRPIGGDGASADDDWADKRARAYRAMAADMDDSARESWAIRRDLLDKERAEYGKFIEDKALLDQWYGEQKAKLDIGEDKASGSMWAGMRAGVAEMKRDLPTIGELGADLAETFRDGMVNSLTDAVFEARNLGDALKEVGRGMAKMAFQWAMQQAVTGGMSAIFKVPGRAAGGPVSAGMPYMVGERGPELFLPDRGGTIVPTQGMTAPNVSIQVVNNGQSKSAQVTQPQFDGTSWVIGVILDDLDHGGPLADRLN
jgi:hypothetical protein